jgi:hypothetical protein
MTCLVLFELMLSFVIDVLLVTSPARILAAVLLAPVSSPV